MARIKKKLSVHLSHSSEIRIYLTNDEVRRDLYRPCKSRVSFYTSIIRGVSSKIISLGRKRVSEECHFRLSGLHNKTVADG